MPWTMIMKNVFILSHEREQRVGTTLLKYLFSRHLGPIDKSLGVDVIKVAWI